MMATVEGYRIGGDDGPFRKKPKLSELPLSSAKRSTIDGLLHGFKKRGEFDGLRKKIYAQFEQGVGMQVMAKITGLTIDRTQRRHC